VFLTAIFPPLPFTALVHKFTPFFHYGFFPPPQSESSSSGVFNNWQLPNGTETRTEKDLTHQLIRQPTAALACWILLVLDNICGRTLVDCCRCCGFFSSFRIFFIVYIRQWEIIYLFLELVH
jgi:hypothetical protein